MKTGLGSGWFLKYKMADSVGNRFCFNHFRTDWVGLGWVGFGFKRKPAWGQSVSCYNPNPSPNPSSSSCPCFSIDAHTHTNFRLHLLRGCLKTEA
ncbi:hypothetical protein QVD17_11773 [Tagetes erecta]|uniref:Uncharacterized protein n=1 Tax=Tagetes erecta TaxID=13708 RepID=A0AAD8KU26_TARER|nr:hypothetical protein QVD17_11773 [Tagetes erecta]